MLKMQFSLLFIFLLPLVYSKSLDGFSCICGIYPCPVASECTHGLVEDPCDCCSVGLCAKGENQECGGRWNLAGTCADNLKCERTFPRFPQLPGICKPDHGQDNSPALPSN